MKLTRINSFAARPSSIMRAPKGYSPTPCEIASLVYSERSAAKRFSFR